MALDSLLISNPVNIRYLTGFPGTDILLLITKKGRPFLLADARIFDQARKKLVGVNVVLRQKPTAGLIKDLITKNGIRQIGFEANHISLEAYFRLKRTLGGIKLMPVKNMVEGLRMIKSRDEISKIKRSAAASLKILKNISNHIRPGITEREIARKIDLMILSAGGVYGFDTIVASGRNSAFPHAIPSGKKIAKNDVVLIDFGTKLNSYNSDITRIIFKGTVKKQIQKMYKAVKKAHALAIEMIKPGAIISTVVKKVNALLENEGFGNFLLHGLGHGVGLDIHELPYLSSSNPGRFRKNMVFTVEPGIYVPTLGGIRIEDIVAINDKEKQVLTR